MTASPISSTSRAQSLSYPAGGERTVETRLGELGKESFAKADFSRWGAFAKWGAAGGAIGGAAGALIGHFMFNPDAGRSKASYMIAGAITGVALLGGAMGIWGAASADDRSGDVRDLAHEDAVYSTTFDVAGRPALPDASQVPTVEATTRVGEYVDGISGTSIGSVVTFSQKFMEATNMRVTTTQNTNGEPVISIGGVSNTTTSYDLAVDTVSARHNTLGIGKVLYDTAGYSSLREAKGAIDGKHSVAIVQEKGRYYLTDFDAESFEQISHSNAGMIINDDRVKAIYTNKNVYYPTTLTIGPATQGDVAPATGKVFLFAQGQDIDQNVPASVASLVSQPIGTYDTNARGTKDKLPDLFTLNVARVHGGDEYSGPGWANRAEAVGYMLSTPGNQALVKGGDRYYVADTFRQSTQNPTTSDRSFSLDQIVDSSTTGAFIHGIRTADAARAVEVIEENGGLYAPVGDWWVKANLSE